MDKILKYKEYIINQFKTNRKRSFIIVVGIILVICGLSALSPITQKEKILAVRAKFNKVKCVSGKAVCDCMNDAYAASIIKHNIIDYAYNLHVLNIPFDKLSKTDMAKNNQISMSLKTIDASCAGK